MISQEYFCIRNWLFAIVSTVAIALLNPVSAIAQGAQQSEAVASGQGAFSSNLFAFDGELYFGLDEGSTGSLRRVSMDGGAVETVATNIAVGSARGSGFVEVVGEEVFFGAGDYDIFRVEKVQKDGANRSLLVTTSGGYMMGVIGSDVYFFSGFCCIRAVSVAGGSSTQVVTGRFWPRAETRDDDSIYFVDYSTRNLYRYSPLQSNTPVLLLAGNGINSLEGSLLLGPQYAYRVYPGYVLEVPKDGGSARRIDLPYADASAHGVDDNYIYFSRAGVGLFTLSLSDGSVDSIDDNARVSGRLVSKPGQIFWPDIRLGQNQYAIYRASVGDPDGVNFELPMQGNVQLTQDFECFNCVGRGAPRFHTGVDLISDQPSVMAAASGLIHRIFLSIGDPVWCDGSSSGRNNPKFSTESRQFGNTVILKHEDPSSPTGAMFSQYSHLDCIERSVADDYVSGTLDSLEVAQGQVLGRFGNSCTAARECQRYGKHLHFEVKTTDVLGNAVFSGVATEVGYTPQRAVGSSVGYLDPLEKIGPAPEVVADLPLLVTPKSVSIPVYPGPDEYPFSCQGSANQIGGELGFGAQMVVRKQVTTSNGLWYKIDKGTIIKSGRAEAPVLSTCNSDSGKVSDSNEPDGWVRADDVIQYFGFMHEVTGTEPNSIVTVHLRPDFDSLQIAQVYVGQLYPIKRKRPANTDRPCGGEWLEIDLAAQYRTAARELSSSGWICTR